MPEDPPRPRLDRKALATALNAVETMGDAPLSEARAAIIDDAWAHPRGRAIGVTGPPGVGKSTLCGRLVQRWRSQGLTVAVLCVDPSSRRGGAFLGDRLRMRLDGSDPDVFVRSMAARGRLGGLAPRAFEAVTVMRAAADVVLVETVGVGQSEVEVADLVEVTAVVIQPGSGDALQFLKAGLMEVFDRLVVNKSDLGALASNAARELRAALRLQGRREVPVHLVSAEDGAGIDVLADALVGGTPDPGRRGDALRRLMVDRFRAWHGERIVVALGGHAALVEALAGAPDRDTMTPGAAWKALESRLRG